MLKFKLGLFIIVFSVISLSAQKSVNDYKYIIVPVQYEFQKSEDLYQVNSLAKFLFNKEGFETYLSSELLPEDLRKNRCLALTAKLDDKSKMLSTTLVFELVDCNNNVIFTSVPGKSKEKDYKKSYHECVRESFEGIKALNYVYSGEVNSEVVTSTEVVTETNNTDSDAEVAAVVGVAAAVETEAISKQVEAKKEVAENVLYAQSIANGFQLVDSTPKVLYVIRATTVKDVYVIKDNSGIVYKENGVWKADFYRDGVLISKELNIKFF